MIEIRDLPVLELDVLQRIIRGYVSREKYVVSRQETEATFNFTLELAQLASPYVKRYELESADFYQSAFESGFSLGAYHDTQVVAVALAEPQTWNQSLVIHEFHVAEAYRGRGVGRALMEALIRKARDAGLQTMVCETQNTNVPAIRFYRRMGFTLDGLDLSFYSHDERAKGEFALFMKRRV